MSQARLLALTEEIYDAAAGATPWHAVGEGLTTLLNGATASLILRDPAGGSAEVVYHTNLPHQAVAEYAARYRAHDIWTTRAAQALRDAPRGEFPVWTSGVLVPDTEYLSSLFWNGFGRHYGLRYVVGTVVPLGAAGQMGVGVHRPPAATRFDEPERRLLAAALPHLRRALQLRHRLAVVPEASAGPPGIAALDGLSTAVVVTDAQLGVVLANAAAEALAGHVQGFRFRRSGGSNGSGATQMVPCQRADAAALMRVVAATAMAGAPGGALRLHTEEGEPAVAALVTPLPARLAQAPLHVGGRVAGQALILLRPLVAPSVPRAALLRELFGLTAAEAEVARALAGGQSKGAVAARRGLKESTVRTQVRAVLEKTGATNLRDLERMLAGLAGL